MYMFTFSKKDKKKIYFVQNMNFFIIHMSSILKLWLVWDCVQKKGSEILIY